MSSLSLLPISSFLPLLKCLLAELASLSPPRRPANSCLLTCRLLTSLPATLAGFKSLKKHFSDSHLLSPRAGEEIVCRSFRRTQIGQTAVRQNKRIISRWYLFKVDFKEASRGLLYAWSVVDCVWATWLVCACVFSTFIHQKKCQLKALGLCKGLEGVWFWGSHQLMCTFQSHIQYYAKVLGTLDVWSLINQNLNI